MRLALVPVSLMILGCTGLLGADDKTSETGATSDCASDVWYADQDGDGFGDHARHEKGCNPPDDYVQDDSDCDDGDPNVFPGGVEVCDSVDADEDCDGDADEADEDVQLDTFFRDGDGDAFGDADTTKKACDQPAGYVTDDTDCDDTDEDVNPDGKEICDASEQDEDCDGDVNDDDASMSTTGLSKFYEDNDGDDYGDGSAITACDAGSGYAERDGDCDDDEAKANPGETEDCNDGIDNDCDGTDNGCGFAGTFTSASADAIVEGDSANDGAGLVFPAGDQDGDGNDDFVVAAYGSGTSGAGHLFYGGFSGRTDTSSDDVTISGVSSEGLGWSGAGGFDWNDDGDPDIAISAPYKSPGGSTNGGTMYVYYGPVTSDVSTSAADHSVSGGTYGYVSFYIHGADWDGDGKDDLAYESDDTLYLDRGPTSTGSGSVSGDITFTQSGSYTDADFADVNGDGADDILIGGGWSSSYTGTAWYAEGGSKTGSLNMSSASDSYFTGASTDDYSGSALALCDLDDDGQADAVIGALGAEGGATDSGNVYIFSAKFTAGGQSVNSADATLEGNAKDDQFGAVVACAGDVNTDGNEDIAVIAPYADSGGADSGTSYIFFGPLSGTISAGAADAILKGDGASDTPWSIAGIGDHNGDGAQDIGIGSRYNDDGGTDAGSVWVFDGGGI